MVTSGTKANIVYQMDTPRHILGEKLSTMKTTLQKL
jgi:hypothetical protein